MAVRGNPSHRQIGVFRGKIQTRSFYFNLNSKNVLNYYQIYHKINAYVLSPECWIYIEKIIENSAAADNIRFKS